jgi:hypothetical protein
MASSVSTTTSNTTAHSPPAPDKRDYVWRGTVDVVTIRIWRRDPSAAHDLPRTPSRRGVLGRREAAELRQHAWGL